MEKSQLQWACRRGMLELDIILQRYLEQGYPKASKADQATFERLLASADQDLFNWFLGKSQSNDVSLQALVEKIRSESS